MSKLSKVIFFMNNFFLQFTYALHLQPLNTAVFFLSFFILLKHKYHSLLQALNPTRRATTCTFHNTV